jgi:hypothetical protein
MSNAAYACTPAIKPNDTLASTPSRSITSIGIKEIKKIAVVISRRLNLSTFTESPPVIQIEIKRERYKRSDYFGIHVPNTRVIGKKVQHTPIYQRPTCADDTEFYILFKEAFALRI